MQFQIRTSAHRYASYEPRLLSLFGAEDRSQAARKLRGVDRLVKKEVRTVFVGAALRGVGRKRGDENDRQAVAARDELSLHLEPGHAGHLDIADHACGLSEFGRTKKRLGRCIELHA